MSVCRGARAGPAQAPAQVPAQTQLQPHIALWRHQRHVPGEPCSILLVFPAPARQRGHDGEQAVEREEVHGGERAVDGEGGLGKQPGGSLEQVGTLDAAVQVQKHRAHEARLVAEVQQALRMRIARWVLLVGPDLKMTDHGIAAISMLNIPLPSQSSPQLAAARDSSC